MLVSRSWYLAVDEIAVKLRGSATGPLDINKLCKKLNVTCEVDTTRPSNVVDITWAHDAPLGSGAKHSAKFVLATHAALADSFCIAHLAGHLLLHTNYSGAIRKPVVEKTYVDDAVHIIGFGEADRQADRVALSLLMPMQAFVKRMRKAQRADAYDLAPVARFFRVPEHLVLRWAKWLGLVDASE